MGISSASNTLLVVIVVLSYVIFNNKQNPTLKPQHQSFNGSILILYDDQVTKVTVYTILFILMKKVNIL